MQIHPAPGRPSLGIDGAEHARGWAGLGDRAVAIAHRAALRPYAATLALVTCVLLLIGAFAVAGKLVFGDPSELFRELMPGTLLSVAQLSFVAVVAFAIHREVVARSRLRLDSLWGISVVVFAALAIDEATQLTIFLGDGLGSVGVGAPAGFQDLDAFLLTALLVASGAVLVRYGAALLAHPGAMVLIGIGVVLGGSSQALDSTLASTTNEFVAEESLKLAAEPFLIGAYLVVLRNLSRARAAAGRGPLV